MIRWWWQLLGLALWPALVRAVAPTDQLQDADPPQSGYLPNHNMDPKVVRSRAFTKLWSNSYNKQEVFYAKPLTWTPPGGTHETVITVSNQNIIRIIDGINGSLINSRTLDPPFQSVDLHCDNIPDTVGITGTPIIDADTDIMYLFSKGYKGGVKGPAGTINGQYKMYAIQLPSLEDVDGFPVIIDGHHADNDATRYFLGGTVLQRPGLAMVGSSIVAGFGAHCDLFNYTGMLISVSKKSGVGVTSIIAMEAEPAAPKPQALNINDQGGGKAGIWQAGMGIACVDNRTYFVTGNAAGGGGANAKNKSANGKVPISTLDNCAARFAVDPESGVLTQEDYFEPFNYQHEDGADQDFGSSGACVLDPKTFSGGGINRLVLAGGKTGKIYVMDADNMGGFKTGHDQSDGVVQIITGASSLFSGLGSYPGEGGYIYYAQTNDNLHALKMGYDKSGKPFFTEAGKSALKIAGKGVPTITSLNGFPGSAIVWIADVDNGLVAYRAVPSGGTLSRISIPSTGRLTRFQRPAFGNGRVYTISENTVIALGTRGTAGPQRA